MQRVRMSLPYFEEFGWKADVVSVKLSHSDMVTDELLAESLPEGVKVYYVDAFSKKWTAKFGLGSIGLRSLYFFRKKVNSLLQQKSYDLIYFSTTQFPVCVLGAYWKKKFGVPYVIDMQDPWHSDFYQDKPKAERPPKYWAAYRISKYLEPIAMRNVDGLISVSAGYLTTLAERYSNCKRAPQKVITFGAFEPDMEIARQNVSKLLPAFSKKEKELSVVYVGRGGKDMAHATALLLRSFKEGLEQGQPGFERIHFYFIGTSYAAAGQGIPTIAPIAEMLGVGSYVTEITDRIPFYQTLNTLDAASALFIPGSNDPHYTASKIYPYVLAEKPLLAFFHPASSAVTFLKACGAGTVLTFDQEEVEIEEQMIRFLSALANNSTAVPSLNQEVINEYSARTMTRKQCELFNAVVK